MIQTKERKKRGGGEGVDRRIPFRSSKRVLDRPKRNEEEQVLRPPGSCLPPGTPRFDSPRPVSSSSIPPSPPRFLLLLLLLLLVVLLTCQRGRCSRGDVHAVHTRETWRLSHVCANLVIRPPPG